MANTNVPSKPLLANFNGTEAYVKWSSPVSNGHTWIVYADTVGTPPLAGPAYTSGLKRQEATVTFSLVGGYTPGASVYIAVSSVNLTTGEESSQSPVLLVQAAAGESDDDGGTIAFVARMPDGTPSTLAVDSSGALSVGGAPGGATAANQVTEITKLTSIDGKTPALGQAAMAASTPVVLASNQSRVLTAESFTSAAVPASVSVGASSVAIPATPMVGRRSLVVYNNGNTDLLLGIGGTNLIPLAPRTPVVLDVTDSVLVTASRASGTFPVIYWEFA